MTKKVLWFSRHEMSNEQAAALGECEIVQINRTISHATEIADEIDAADVIAIVAPISLQQEFLRLACDKPVIMAVNDRVIVPSETGGGGQGRIPFCKVGTVTSNRGSQGGLHTSVVYPGVALAVVKKG